MWNPAIAAIALSRHGASAEKVCQVHEKMKLEKSSRARV
tara:strand:- start:227 stop:343 length:117 start_codon:yes stop_codon:yes gene_type:complete